MNEISFQITTEKINWQEVAGVLHRSGLSSRPAEEQEVIFTNSYAVVFAFHKETVIGVARAISDGVCQAAVYNVALDEEYQGHGIGRELITRLLDQVRGQNVILYTHPRTVALYEKMGFRRNKTAMSIFCGSEETLNWMNQQGFLLPEKFRFADEYGREDMKR
ncbi:GNAT family N-acetyltransferase [Lachnospiraceae bacterium 54-53]